MLYFGAMKIGASDMMVNFVGGAGAKMGLGFLSVHTWFWIAVIGEIVAGLFLLLGGKWTKIGAILTLIIMMFAGNAIGWNFSMVNWTLTTLAALVMLFYGTGCWSDDPNCCGGTCETKIGGIDLGNVAGVGAMVGAGTQLLDNVKDKVGEVANIDGLKDIVAKVGDMDAVANLKDKASDLIE